MHRDFRRLWAAQTLSVFGSQITVLALPLTAVLTLDASPSQVGFLTAAATAPYLLFSLFAGVWVDRSARRPILIATDVGRAALLATVPVAAVLDILTIQQLYLVAFLVGTLSVFFDVAYQSFLPSLVSREQLVEGNSKLQISQSGALIAGPGAAGGLVQIATAPVAIAIDAVTFLLSALFLSRIQQPEPAAKPAKPNRRMWSDIREGQTLVLRHDLLRPLTASTATMNLFITATQPVFIVFLTSGLELSPGAIGVIFAGGSVGFLLGALMVGRVVERVGLGSVLLVSPLPIAVAMLVVALTSGPAIVAASIVLVAWSIRNIAAVFYDINNQSLRQMVTPDALLGRVTATTRFLGLGIRPIAALLGGLLAEWIGLRPTLVVGGCGVLLAFLWLWLSPVRTLDRSNLSDQAAG